MVISDPRHTEHRVLKSHKSKMGIIYICNHENNVPTGYHNYDFVAHTTHKYKQIHIKMATPPGIPVQHPTDMKGDLANK